jgi:hypothetical protein
MHVVTTQTRGRGIHRSPDQRDDSRMDLSDLHSPHAPSKSQAGEFPSTSSAPDDAAWKVATQVGMEVACALTPALDSIRQMQASGRIDRAGLHSLVTQIEQARQASMLGQQIARLAHGGIQQQPETVNLSHALRDVLAQRQDDLRTRGMAVKQTINPADVVVDATLLSALLDAMLDWSLRHACTPVDLRLDTKAWPTHARLVCRYGHTPQDRVDAAAPAPRGAAASRRMAALDCLSWQLLAQLARTMALQIDRADTESVTVLTLEFPHTVNDSLEGLASTECDTGVAPIDDSRPLAGAQVLVIAARREVLNQIRQTLLPMGVGFDSVGSVDAARDFCRQGLPQAIVYESVMYDSAFDGLRNDIKLQCPELAWIEIVEQGDAFEISSFGGMSMARVGRNAIASSLPSALMFELARGL